MSARPRILNGAIAWTAFAVSILLAPSMIALPADASIRHHHWVGGGTGGSPTDPDKDAALIVDGATGKSLYERNADALRHPASLTKMMTLYLLFEQLKSGQMTLATPIPVSEHAASQHPTKLHVRQRAHRDRDQGDYRAVSQRHRGGSGRINRRHRIPLRRADDGEGPRTWDDPHILS
jgi:D-alanyl-D-alanine carboxypeptidase